MLSNSQSSTFEVIGPDKSGGFTVKGFKATIYEFNVSIALEKLNIDYIFQFQFFGGRALRGGMVVDFLAYTSPLPTPIWVHGEYWHKGRQSSIDRYQEAVLVHQQRGQIAQPVILWGVEVATKEAALSAVRRELRL